MNTAKLAFLQDRVAAVGEKLAAKLDAGLIPSKGELAFLDECTLALSRLAPAHTLRVLVLDLHAAVSEASARRDAWRAGRAVAMASAEAGRQAKIRAGRAARRASAKSAAVTINAVVAEVIANQPQPSALPTGISAQGLPFVVELPLEWQDNRVIA